MSCRQDLTARTRLLIGLPMLTSANSLRFWLALCGALDRPGATQLLQTFASQEAQGKAAMRGFCLQWTSELLSKVCYETNTCASADFVL